MPTHLPVFVVTTWLLAMLPGAGQALMLRQTLEGGLRMAWASIAGTATGLLIWSTAAAAGLSAVLLTNPAAYTVVRVVGGIVLCVLGASTLLSLRRPVEVGLGRADPGPSHARQPVRIERRATIRGGYVAGLFTNLGNPKAGVFAISLLPQFVTATGPVLLSTVAMGAIWALVTTAWYVLFTWAVHRGRTLVSRPAVHRRLRIATGGVLLLLGAAVMVGI